MPSGPDLTAVFWMIIAVGAVVFRVRMVSIMSIIMDRMPIISLSWIRIFPLSFLRKMANVSAVISRVRLAVSGMLVRLVRWSVTLGFVVLIRSSRMRFRLCLVSASLGDIWRALL